MLLGEFRHGLDEKGRLAIPAKFREELGSPFVVTRGLDGCLFCYSQGRWTEVEARLRSMPLASSDARAFMRFFFAGAAEVELDRQGRTVVPQPLREFADLQGAVTVVGVSDRCELWAPERWTRYQETANTSPEAMLQRLGELGVLGL